MKKQVLFVVITFLTGISSFAQTKQLKLAYVNSIELLQAMPERVQADSDLAKFARTFQNKLEAMGAEYQTKVQAYQSNQATMTEAIKEVNMKELQDLQSRIEQLQQTGQDQIGQKKQQLYQPVLDKADKAIKAVAKDEDYDFIFDASQGQVLFAKDEYNILGLVKAKLGIK